MAKTFGISLGLAEPDEEKADRQFVTSLARGLEVLRAFQPEDGSLGNQELAARTGLPKPTVSRITHTLTMLGYLDYDARHARYMIAPAVLSLGHACVGAII
jgi:DNA-binding IclR family transcriptional regulator